MNNLVKLSFSLLVCFVQSWAQQSEPPYLYKVVGKATADDLFHVVSKDKTNHQMEIKCRILGPFGPANTLVLTIRENGQNVFRRMQGYTYGSDCTLAEKVLSGTSPDAPIYIQNAGTDINGKMSCSYIKLGGILARILSQPYIYASQEEYQEKLKGFHPLKDDIKASQMALLNSCLAGGN